MPRETLAANPNAFAKEQSFAGKFSVRQVGRQTKQNLAGTQEKLASTYRLPLMGLRQKIFFLALNEVFSVWGLTLELTRSPARVSG